MALEDCSFLGLRNWQGTKGRITQCRYVTEATRQVLAGVDLGKRP